MEIIDKGMFIIPKGASYKEADDMLIVAHPDYPVRGFKPGAIVFSEEGMESAFSAENWDFEQQP